MKNGYYLFLRNGKDYFFTTEKKSKTTALAKEIATAAGFNSDPEALAEIKRRISHASLEIKHSERWGDYYNIFGDNFSGAGYFLDGRDGTTTVYTLKA